MAGHVYADGLLVPPSPPYIGRTPAETHALLALLQIVQLQRITEPMYRPIRRILPDFGALDLSPLVVLLILYILTNIVVPNIAQSLLAPGL